MPRYRHHRDEQWFVNEFGLPRFVVVGDWPGGYFVLDLRTSKRRGTFKAMRHANRRAELLQRRARIK